MAPTIRPLWGVEDVSAYLGVPIKTLYKWRTEKYGPDAMRLGKHLRYDPEDVVAWVNAQKLAS
jgi:predicted DNA-binding transcriptional regulator AlpA